MFYYRKNRSASDDGSLVTHASGLVELKFFFPVVIVLQRFLIFFVENEVFENKGIHFGAHKTTIGLFGCAHNRFSTNIEGGVDQDCASSYFFEFADQVVISFIGILMT